MKRNQLLGALIEGAAIWYATYWGLPEHQRREIRMRFWWFVQHISSDVAYKLGRISIAAELHYKRETAGVR